LLEKILEAVDIAKENLRSNLLYEEQQSASNYALAQLQSQAQAQNFYPHQLGNINTTSGTFVQSIPVNYGVGHMSILPLYGTLGYPHGQQPPQVAPCAQGGYSIGQSTKVDLDFCVDMIMAAVQKSFQEQLPDIIREVVREEIKKALMERANEPGT